MAGVDPRMDHGYLFAQTQQAKQLVKCKEAVNLEPGKAFHQSDSVVST